MNEKLEASVVQVKDDRFNSFYDSYLNEALELVNKLVSSDDGLYIKKAVFMGLKYLESLKSQYGEEISSIELVDLEDFNVIMSTKVILSTLKESIVKIINEIYSEKSGKYKLKMERNDEIVLFTFEKVSIFERKLEPTVSIKLPRSILSYSHRSVGVALFATILGCITILTENPFVN